MFFFQFYVGAPRSGSARRRRRRRSARSMARTTTPSALPVRAKFVKFTMKPLVKCC